MKNVVMFSGGKDSTAMLLLMIEKKIPIDVILFADTGKEYPQMYEHVAKVEEHISCPITRIYPETTYEEIALEYIVNKKKPEKTRVGMGWTTVRNRWCTYHLKVKPIRKYLKSLEPYRRFVGITVDEPKRIEKKVNNVQLKDIQYPLIEYGFTQKDSLDYCYSRGFDWGGLYEKTKRVSCYICPLQSIGQLKNLYFNYPELWSEMRSLEEKTHNSFWDDYTIFRLEEKFEALRGGQG